MCKSKNQEPQHGMRKNNQIFGTTAKHVAWRIIMFCGFRLRYGEVKLSRERRRFVMGGVEGSGEKGG